MQELVDPTTGTWDEQLINDIFWPKDAHLILEIPLHDGADDFIAWHFDERGLHSVRQAYN